MMIYYAISSSTLLVIYYAVNNSTRMISYAVNNSSRVFVRVKILIRRSWEFLVCSPLASI
jgi:hypothetical protein